MKDSKAGFVIEPLVFVDLVGPDGRLDRAFQLHPGNVALVVIVAQEGFRARGEKTLQGRLARGLWPLRARARRRGSARLRIRCCRGRA